jgi:hypothetical protein
LNTRAERKPVVFGLHNECFLPGVIDPPETGPAEQGPLNHSAKALPTVGGCKGNTGNGKRCDRVLEQNAEDMLGSGFLQMRAGLGGRNRWMMSDS